MTRAGGLQRRVTDGILKHLFLQPPSDGGCKPPARALEVTSPILFNPNVTQRTDPMRRRVAVVPLLAALLLTASISFAAQPPQPN